MKLTLKIPQAALFIGLILYVFCLWRDCAELIDKGFFMAVLSLGLFAIAVYKRLPETEREASRFSGVCRFMLLLAAGLLLVGVWNLPLNLAEKGLCVAAWFVAMYGAARCSS
ncbi:YiaA/YiaB family inner membrane protein [Pseudocitrobacter cyperus]|uniref:YiaA/YiaB family inner membrane protein n=1 Tax=Pseudocitrobacter cyperus TaxID=3112843 RepID=A0ABV0HN50_9ENTR